MQAGEELHPAEIWGEGASRVRGSQQAADQQAGGDLVLQQVQAEPYHLEWFYCER